MPNQLLVTDNSESTDIVVFVHGLMGSRLDMWPMERRFRRLGFQTWNWSYRSIGNPIEKHIDRLGKDLVQLDLKLDGCKFHLVTHSMGGIIARGVFDRHTFDKLGRVVMLAPPHGGSHVARKLTRWLGWVSPSLSQLSDKTGSFVNRLPNSLLENGIEFGLVEASKDRVIEPGKVMIPGFTEYVLVDGHHGILPWYRRAMDVAEKFVCHGSFECLTGDTSTLDH